MSVMIKKVVSHLDRRRLLIFPWKVYQDDPLWVPPLLPEKMNVIHPKKGVFFERGQAEFFLAYKNGKICGTICVGEDPPTNQFRGKKECIFGFLEYIEDYEVFSALIEQARNWGKQKGLEILYGPWNLDYEDSYGVLVDGRDEPPALMCGHTPGYYQEFMDSLWIQTRPGPECRSQNSIA